MNHFQGVTPEERWKNDQLNELRHQTLILEQIAQLLNEKGKPKRGKRGDDDGKEG